MNRTRVTVGAVLLLCLVVVLSFVTFQQISNLKSDLKSSEDARAVTDSNYEELVTQFQKLCLDPATHNTDDCEVDVQPPPAGPQGDSGSQGPKGDTGPDGPPPSQEDVSAAVVQYCSTTGNCEGKTPTVEQVGAAVRAYCNQNGKCRGPQGPAGDQGPSGDSGDDGAQGPAGPGPTDNQVQQAVNDYCSNHGNCVGPKGDPGDVGDQGPAGSVTPGNYSCPIGQFVGGFTVDASGNVTLDCRNLI